MARHTLLQKWLLLQAIFARRDITSTGKVIAGRLLDHLNSITGICIPKYDTLAEGAGVSRRTAMESVKDLVLGVG